MEASTSPLADWPHQPPNLLGASALLPLLSQPPASSATTPPPASPTDAADPTQRSLLNIASYGRDTFDAHVAQPAADLVGSLQVLRVPDHHLLQPLLGALRLLPPLQAKPLLPSPKSGKHGAGGL